MAGRLTRREKEQRIYALSKVAGVAGVATVVLVLLGLFGVMGLGPAVVTAIVTVACVLLARRSVSS